MSMADKRKRGGHDGKIRKDGKREKEREENMQA